MNIFPIDLFQHLFATGKLSLVYCFSFTLTINVWSICNILGLLTACEVKTQMLTRTSSGTPATASFYSGTGVLQLRIVIAFSYFSNTGPDIHNLPSALSPRPGEFDTNCICLKNQPIHKIKSGCQIVFHWFQSFIPALCVFIPQLRGGRSVKTYNKTCLSQPEGAARPIKNI